MDREQPREEKKFEMINSSHHTLTTVTEELGFSDTLGALNRDNNLNVPTSFVRNPEFSSTSKTAEQMATLQQMRSAVSSSADQATSQDAFNPFKSDGEIRVKSPAASNHSKED